jgi:hypothetical protein
MALLQEESFLYVFPLHKKHRLLHLYLCFGQVGGKANIQINGRLYNNCLNVQHLKHIDTTCNVKKKKVVNI